MEGTKLILIGGTSHVGKSTLGQRLADELGWNYLSTDQLARHPGRPWKVGDRLLPDDVVDHYTRLSVPELCESVLEHYQSNVWPIVDAIVKSRLNNSFDFGLVFEGSAILPDLYCMAGFRRVNAVWLTAPEALITKRIKQSGNYQAGTAAERRLVGTFIDRSIAFDRTITVAAEASGLAVVDASSAEVYDVLKSLV